MDPRNDQELPALHQSNRGKSYILFVFLLRTKQVPHQALIHLSQKNGGCNHMKCERCSLHFCWLCMSSISGYEHFSGGCKLFTGGQNIDPF
jgi:hypothetical protein